MYITKTTSPHTNGRIYHCTLLRESYRENGQVKNRTLANLTKLPDHAIEAIDRALKQPDEQLRGQESGTDESSEVQIEQGLSIGAIATVYEIAKRLGITKALGNSWEGKLALWQVIARVVQPCSRLAVVRLAREHAACDLLKIDESFCEDDLYANLAWLNKQQRRIEKKLFRESKEENKLFLYDVTSSYLEGSCNALGAYGYNRDKKKGKQQIVVGLLTDAKGSPVSVQVFNGNTSDTKTLTAQILKLVHEFGCQYVTLVGDRGMIKQAGIEALQQEEFYFISALTRVQIETLIKAQTIQLELFSEQICEVEIPANDDDNEQRSMRYILKRNPVRAEELKKIRLDKIASIEKKLAEYNIKLARSKQAKLKTALKNVNDYIIKLKLQKWVKVKRKSAKRQLQLSIDEEAIKEHSRLEGCYVIRTDIPKTEVDAKTIHNRYRDLSKVETGFRVSKSYLEMRPWYVTSETSTRGHALVVMLAYKIVHHLERCWKSIDIEVKEAIDVLKQVTLNSVSIAGHKTHQQIPILRPEIQRLLDAADVRLPETLPTLGVDVVTRKKLSKQ